MPPLTHVRGLSTAALSKLSVRSAGASLRCVWSLQTLPPVVLPSIWSLRLHCPAPLGSTGVTRLPRYYGCSDSWTTGSSAHWEHEHRLWRRPGLHASCHQTFRSFRLQPPTVVPTRFWGFMRQAYRTTLLWPPLIGASASFGLRQYLAGSPQRSAESSLLALRTSRRLRSLHPASRRRSYLGLRNARAPRQGLSPC